MLIDLVYRSKFECQRPCISCIVTNTPVPFSRSFLQSGTCVRILSCPSDFSHFPQKSPHKLSLYFGAFCQYSSHIESATVVFTQKIETSTRWRYGKVNIVYMRHTFQRCQYHFRDSLPFFKLPITFVLINSQVVTKQCFSLYKSNSSNWGFVSQNERDQNFTLCSLISGYSFL
jgi:hypothetical protein